MFDKEKLKKKKTISLSTKVQQATVVKGNGNRKKSLLPHRHVTRPHKLPSPHNQPAPLNAIYCDLRPKVCQPH